MAPRAAPGGNLKVSRPSKACCSLLHSIRRLWKRTTPEGANDPGDHNLHGQHQVL